LSVLYAATPTTSTPTPTIPRMSGTGIRARRVPPDAAIRFVSARVVRVSGRVIDDLLRRCTRLTASASNEVQDKTDEERRQDEGRQPVGRYEERVRRLKEGGTQLGLPRKRNDLDPGCCEDEDE